MHKDFPMLNCRNDIHQCHDYCLKIIVHDGNFRSVITGFPAHTYPFPIDTTIIQGILHKIITSRPFYGIVNIITYYICVSIKLHCYMPYRKSRHTFYLRLVEPELPIKLLFNPKLHRMKLGKQR